jgi:hypothetical protein
MPKPTDPEEGAELLRQVEETYRAYRAAIGPERERLLESYLTALRSLEEFMFKRPPS